MNTGGSPACTVHRDGPATQRRAYLIVRPDNSIFFTSNAQAGTEKFVRVGEASSYVLGFGRRKLRYMRARRCDRLLQVSSSLSSPVPKSSFTLSEIHARARRISSGGEIYYIHIHTHMLREEVTQSARTLKASSFAHIEPSPLLKIAACDTTPLPRSELSMYACQLIHLREKILTHSL